MAIMQVALRIFNNCATCMKNNTLLSVEKYHANSLGFLLRKFSSSTDIDYKKFVIHGPKSALPIPDGTVGEYIHKILLKAPKESTSMIDGHSGKYQLYSDLLQKSVNLATVLRHYGYSHQKTVLSICSENSLEYFVPILASFFNASIMQPLNPSYTSYELQRALELVKPKVVFCSEIAAPKILQLRTEGASWIEKIIVMNSSVDKVQLKHINKGATRADTESMKEFIENILKGKDEDVKTFKPIGGDSGKLVAYICSSSGTTGLPKGVVQSQLSVLTRLTHERDPKYFRQEQADRTLGLLPFFHTYGLSSILGCICSLQTVVYLKKFEENLFLKTIQDYKITVLLLVPPLAVFLAKSDKILQYDLSSVKDIFCGAATLDQKVEKKVIERLNCLSFRQGLGMTESTATVTMINQGDRKLGSCGQVVSFMSATVRDPATGHLLGPGQIGELCWKGPLIMMGYYNDKVATDKAFTSDGWYKSGDLGYYNDDGYFFIVDRLKEIIKYKGYQVSPAELEAVLLNHPDVRDAGVIGVPDELAGELPLAFVVKEEGSNITEEHIQKYIKEIVSPYKQLRGGVTFIDAIPRNPGGKILRRVLKEKLKI